MAHTIAIQPRAEADIRATVGWLAQNVSPTFAARWHARIGAAIHSLENNPERCPQADEAADLGADLRELLHGRRRQAYRILFSIDGDTVNVHRVRHAAQDRLQPGDI